MIPCYLAKLISYAYHFTTLVSGLIWWLITDYTVIDKVTNMIVLYKWSDLANVRLACFIIDWLIILLRECFMLIRLGYENFWNNSFLAETMGSMRVGNISPCHGDLARKAEGKQSLRCLREEVLVSSIWLHPFCGRGTSKSNFTSVLQLTIWK